MSVPKSAPTLASALRQGIERLTSTSSSPRLDAEILLAAALKRPRSHLIAYAQELLEPAPAAQFESWLERRATGIPLAYLTGIKEFWSLELEVTPDVLTPRPDTEVLVEQALKWLPSHQASKVLDLGTGSGAIALAIAHERRAAQVFAIDRSASALEVARRNAVRLGLSNVTFMCGSWYEPLAASNLTGFDVIVSNPPYIAADDEALRAPELQAEPQQALTPGPTGLEALEHIAQHAGTYLLRSGWLAMEHGADQGAAVESLLLRQGLQNVRTVQDWAGHDRITCGQSL